jgi:hypothetical protein
MKYLRRKGYAIAVGVCLVSFSNAIASQNPRDPADRQKQGIEYRVAERGSATGLEALSPDEPPKEVIILAQANGPDLEKEIIEYLTNWKNLWNSNDSAADIAKKMEPMYHEDGTFYYGWRPKKKANKKEYITELPDRITKNRNIEFGALSLFSKSYFDIEVGPDKNQAKVSCHIISGSYTVKTYFTLVKVNGVWKIFEYDYIDN